MISPRILFVTVALGGLVAGGWWWHARGNFADPTQGVAQARSVAVTDLPAPQASAGQRIRCDAGGARISFTATKTIAGVSSTVSGGWSRPFKSIVNGWAEADPTTWQVTGAEITVEVGTLWTEHEMLTHNLIACGFFQVQEHPTATFTLRSATPITAPAQNPAKTPAEGQAEALPPTHELIGDLNLNGVTRRIAVPAQITCGPQGVTCSSEFTIDRREFGVVMRDAGVYALLGDDAIAASVVMHLKFSGTWPGTSTVAVGTDPGSARNHTAPAAALTPVRTVTIPFSQVKFDLVLMPAEGPDPALYIGANEVTWDEFLPWALCKDLKSDTDIAEQRALKQRPSKPYVSVDRGFGTAGRPAIGMTRLSAECYCAWLSAATGQHFRLPTEAEWERAWRRSGGGTTAPDQTWADAHATWKGNSVPPGKRWNATRPVRSMAADAGGLWDLAGNAAEWVVPTDGALVVRGGHYLEVLTALGGGGRMVQDDEDWSANDPGDPKSPWWFTDATWTGFRVVCDP